MTLLCADLLSLKLIESWVVYSEDRQLDLGMSEAEALAWAQNAWKASTDASLHSLVLDSTLADRLHALTKVALHDHQADAPLVECWYESVRAISWPADPLGEKAQILTGLAYVTWRQLRRSGDLVGARFWEERVESLVMSQPAIAEYLALRPDSRSEQLSFRFLSEPAVFLVAVANMRKDLNRLPATGLSAAAFLNAMSLLVDRVFSSEEEGYYFRTQAQLGIVAGLKSVGRYQAAAAWLERVEENCRHVTKPESLLTLAKFNRLVIDYECRRFDRAAARAGQLADQFGSLGMPVYVARARYLEGVALKELGRDDEAIRSLELVGSDRHPEVEAWMRGMALTGIAELLGRKGEHSSAIALLDEAWLLIQSSDVLIALANFHGSSAEVLRGHGDLAKAIAEYRMGVRAYAEGGQEGMAAYLRILLAETLLAAGQEKESAAEVLEALPTIEKLGLVQEAFVAVAFLQESLRRQQADPEALRRLRLELQKMRGEPQ